MAGVSFLLPFFFWMTRFSPSGGEPALFHEVILLVVQHEIVLEVEEHEIAYLEGKPDLWQAGACRVRGGGQ